ncbi:MAG: regulatory protein RecX [Lachnospiraceae bacterium]|nr:regulatory protein RecX [Lachnospiraceae bacterium]MDD7178983.1 regulatory protein RecX [bacterium]MDY5518088.1 regulatory protein RecX [Lachnospiraceae bacterium]
MNDVTVVSIGQLSGGKRRLQLDNGEIWVLYRGELRECALSEGTRLSLAQYEQIRHEIIGKRAKKRAMHLLEKMDRTEQALRKKLLEGEYPEDLVEEAIAYVKSFHYLDDERYADCYVRLHGESKSRGKLLMELQQKGVDRELADRVLEQYEEARDETQMIRLLLQKRHYDPKTATVQEQRRMYGYLVRRGFQSTDICRLLFES